MTFRPIKTWSYPGALLDALVATRRVVADVELPMPLASGADADDLIEQMLDQLDHHLIPRVRDEASPAIVVVAGSTGAGKSTVVNALLGEELTASGVLRPTTKVPHLFHHPLDVDVLTEVAKRAKVAASEGVPRGLAIVDSPDLDSVRGENREVAQLLLEAADLWVFVTTAARYGDAVPWEALREGAARGASIAMVLNRVGADVAAQVRRELVQRLATEKLEGMPLFVIPEDPQARGAVPRDVVGGLGRWLDQVAAQSATIIVERTLHGALEAMKDDLEKLALLIDEQSDAAKVVRADVRRCVSVAETAGGRYWYKVIPTGSLVSRWDQAYLEGGPLYKLRTTLWSMRPQARRRREEALAEIARDLTESVEASLTFTAAQASIAMVETLDKHTSGPGPWLVQQSDPREARRRRELTAGEATRRWMDACLHIALELPDSRKAVRLLGESGVAVAVACAALGNAHARSLLQNVTSPSLGRDLERARAALADARRHVLNREALDMMRPTDVAALMPDASSGVRLRRAELRGLV